jgi:hypothetical protein
MNSITDYSMSPNVEMARRFGTAERLFRKAGDASRVRAKSCCKDRDEEWARSEHVCFFFLQL